MEPTTRSPPPATPRRVNAHWRYAVPRHRRRRELRTAAKLTVQIVDRAGHAHPVQFGTSKKNVTESPVPGNLP